MPFDQQQEIEWIENQNGFLFDLKKIDFLFLQES